MSTAQQMNTAEQRSAEGHMNVAENSSAEPAVLITGASRGIGLAIARALQEDFHLILTARDRAALSAAAGELRSAEILPLDLMQADSITGSAHDLLQRLSAANRRLAAVVHSAGILVSGRVADLDAADWQRSFAMNVTAPATLTAALLPALREAAGMVVFINSGSGFTAGAGGGAYAASKFALRALADALREEERNRRVRVVSIHPGRVDTDMQHELRGFEQGEYEPEKYLSPEAVAIAVRTALQMPPGAVVESLSVRPL